MLRGAPAMCQSPLVCFAAPAALRKLPPPGDCKRCPWEHCGYVFQWARACILLGTCCLNLFHTRKFACLCQTFAHLLAKQVYGALSGYVCLIRLSRFSHVQLFVTLWIIACQASLSMGFSRHEYWSGLPCPLGIKPVSPAAPALQADSLPLSHQGNPIWLYIPLKKTLEGTNSESWTQITPRQKRGCSEGCSIVNNKEVVKIQGNFTSNPSLKIMVIITLLCFN